MIKISVITVTYNAEKAIDTTLESVFKQNYPAIEHIIIDGVSTDNTTDIAKDYIERSTASDNGHETKLIVENDNGIYDAMNKGLAAASGEYICFLNAGDAFKDCDVVRSIVSVAEKSCGELPAVIYGETDIVDERGNFIAHRKLKAPAELTWRSFKMGMLVCHQAFFARTDIAKTIPYNMVYRFSADFDWCIRIMKVAEERNLKLTSVGRPIINYLNEGATTKNHRKSLIERMHIMEHYYGKVSTWLRHIWFALR